MKENIQILIGKDRLTLWHPAAREDIDTAGNPEIALGERLRTFQAQVQTGGQVGLFVSEDLLFYKSFQLPLKTPSLKEAISLQLGMLTPFPEEALLYGFEADRQKDGYQVHLYAAKREPLEGYLQELSQAGFQIAGLFPEHQRYIGRNHPRDRWALALPGRFTKVLVFSGANLAERLLGNVNPSFGQLTEACGTEAIYSPEPGEGGFQEAGRLLSGQPLLRHFNLLPASYRRPDYLKKIILVLLALNVAALLGLAGTRVFQLQSAETRLEAEISQLAPQVEELKNLQAQAAALQEYTQKITELGRNPDLVDFLERLTAELPSHSYLAQMRMDPGNKTISMQGYTADIGELTTSLQKLGDAKLKSTSLRKDQTYFDVEVSLP